MDQQSEALAAASSGYNPQMVPTMIQRDQMLFSPMLGTTALGPSRVAPEVNMLRAENQGLQEHLRYTEDRAEQEVYRVKATSAEKLRKEYDRYRQEFQQAFQHLKNEQALHDKSEKFHSDQITDEARSEAAAARVTCQLATIRANSEVDRLRNLEQDAFQSASEMEAEINNLRQQNFLSQQARQQDNMEAMDAVHQVQSEADRLRAELERERKASADKQQQLQSEYEKLRKQADEVYHRDEAEKETLRQRIKAEQSDRDQLQD